MALLIGDACDAPHYHILRRRFYTNSLNTQQRGTHVGK